MKQGRKKMIHDMVVSQRTHFDAGATRPLPARLAALKKLQSAIRQNEKLLCNALYADLNKAPTEAYMTEIGIVLDELRFALQHLPGWMKHKTVPTSLAHFHSKSLVVPEPYGLALILSPWNYPVQLSLTPLIGAISAGNCAILKPSNYAPATSHALAKLLRSCFDASFVAVIEGGRQENQELLLEKFDYIFFTGSVAVGKLVMESAAKHLTPVSLELGGKSPVIVDETADIPLAAKRITFGKLINAGQTCVAPDYLLVQENVHDSLLRELKAAIESSFPGSDLRTFPSIVNDHHFQRLSALLKSGTLYSGGKTEAATRHIFPTILDKVSPDDPIMQEEIFGPILPVLTYKTIEEAISFVNARPHPLALYLFTRNPHTEQRVIERIRFGGGCVNDTVSHMATSYMGFGGVGESGMGSYHGKLSFDTFTHYKSILKKSSWVDLPWRYLPYTPHNDKWIRRLLK